MEDLTARVDRLEATAVTLRAKLAAHERWARLDKAGRSAATKLARQAAEDRWLTQARQQHPDADDAELAAIAANLRGAHYTRMALRSVQARRRPKAAAT